VGEKFDNLEIITLGILDNPARQICSDIATVCLPDEMRKKITLSHRGIILHPLSATRDERQGRGSRLFVSPNGFAEFFGAPRGNQIKQPGQVAKPHIEENNNEDLLPKLWKLGDTAMTRTWKMMKRR
jgi:hypothetical protein